MEILKYSKLLIIFGIGLGIRLILIPFDIPIANDGFDAFIYASKLIQESQLPNGFNTGNTGWQYFLSIFFSNSNFDEPLNLMNIQRTLSTIISASIVFPLYILLRRFFEEKFVLLGCILFIFEPRFLLTSLLGINYPFFIFLLLIALISFLNNKKNMIFLTFTCVAISSLVRFESLLFIPFFIIMYLLRNNNKKEAMRLASAVFILVIILLPISALRTEANGEDGLVSQLLHGPSFVSRHVIGDMPDINDKYYNDAENRFFDFVSLSITNMFTLFGLSLVPYFIIFCVIGAFFILKNRKYRDLNYEKVTIILFSIIIIIPAFYAYGRGIMEIRYLFGLLPIFSIIGTYGIYVVYNKISRKNVIFLSTICLVVIFSAVFIDSNIPNYEYESASYFISKEILKRTDNVNSFHGDWHLKTAHLLTNWPHLPEANQSGKYSIIINKIDIDEYENFEDFLIDSKNKNLKYVVVSNKDNIIEYNEHPFLIEEINSLDYGYYEKFQIFKIINSKIDE